MLKFFRQLHSYTTAKLVNMFNSKADPRIQIQQAIDEEIARHRRLKEAAAGQIASRNATERELEQAQDELDTAKASAKQALMMANEAEQEGDDEKAQKYADAADSFANRAVVHHERVEELTSDLEEAVKEAEQAHELVRQSERKLEENQREKQRLLRKLGRAEMREQSNASRQEMHEIASTDAPSLQGVSKKINERLDKADGAAEIDDRSSSGYMTEVESAVSSRAAHAMLSEMKSELGMSSTGSVSKRLDDNADIEADIEKAVSEEKKAKAAQKAQAAS